MPIELATPITPISRAAFHEIDERMVGHAFAIHNQFGRLLDESVYKKELANRCAADGMEAQQESRIRVEHGSFVKDYFIDLLLCRSTIVEAKTTKETLTAHQGQGINYLLLAGTHHGSLLNFRPNRVSRRFFSTRLTPEMRRHFVTVDDDWPTDDDHGRLRACLVGFCADVGLGLDLPLYREALAVLGEFKRHLVPIVSRSHIIGHQEMTMVRADVGLAVTALEERDDYRHHLRRLLANTPLKGISWVNLRLGEIRLEQLKR